MDGEKAMQCETECNDETEELAVKLGEIVHTLHRSGLFSYRDIAGAMMAVSLEIARQDQGGVQTAEWLRGIADEIERPELRKPLQ